MEPSEYQFSRRHRGRRVATLLTAVIACALLLTPACTLFFDTSLAPPTDVDDADASTEEDGTEDAVADQGDAVDDSVDDGTTE